MASSSAVLIRPVQAELRLRNVRTRMTPKYGAAVLVGCPLAHLWLAVEGPDGTRIEGLAGDCLPPGWYDKRPGRTFQMDVDELSSSLRQARETLLELAQGGPRSVFGFWHELYTRQLEWAREQGHADLTGNFGTSVMERALIDAAGKLAGKSFHACVKENLLGIEPEAVHDYLSGWTPAEALAETPLPSIHVRHTVGGVDPLTAADVPDGAKLDDGLPQTLEEYLREERVRYFKLKTAGKPDSDLARLQAIARLLDEMIPESETYRVTLDGNEQCTEPGALVELLERIAKGEVSERFADALLFVEQPFPRARTLDDAIVPELAKASALKPVIIDESEANLESVPRAMELGYAGFAVKSAKGPIKAIINKGVLARHPKRPARPVVSGEDMMNLPVAPLHTDLSVMAALGVEHVERNGHHFCRGLDHLAPSEREALLAAHPNLYHKKEGGLAALATESGALDVRSINARPGFGIDGATEMDRESMTPLDEWTFDSMDLS